MAGMTQVAREPRFAVGTLAGPADALERTMARK